MRNPRVGIDAVGVKECYPALEWFGSVGGRASAVFSGPIPPVSLDQGDKEFSFYYPSELRTPQYPKDPRVGIDAVGVKECYPALAWPGGFGNRASAVFGGPLLPVSLDQGNKVKGKENA